MNDTSPEAEAQLARLLSQRSGSDRVLMCLDMFKLARALMTSRIKSEHPDITEAELRVKVFERTYRNDFTAEEMTRITTVLRARWAELLQA